MNSVAKQNLVLIGMCGSGKSTVGILLAKALGRNFVDTDIYIQALENRSLQQLIDDKGLAEFCKLEESHVLCIDIQNAVIATGGSVVYSDAAMKQLSDNGTIIHLDLPLAHIEQRVTNLYTRGVVMEKTQTLAYLYKNRQPLYEKYAELTIDCTDKTQEQIVEQIVSKIPA